MTGIEKITDDILQQAQTQANAIVDQARQEAKRILEISSETCRKKELEISKKIQAEEQNEQKKARLRAKMESGQRTLAKKQALIEETIRLAKQQVLAKEDKAYFSMLFSLFTKQNIHQDCMLFLNQRDLQRIPSNFIQNINKTMQQGNVTISPDPVAIEGGFIAQYENIEENCSIEAIFNAKREEISDIIQKILF